MLHQSGVTPPRNRFRKIARQRVANYIAYMLHIRSIEQVAEWKSLQQSRLSNGNSSVFHRVAKTALAKSCATSGDGGRWPVPLHAAIDVWEAVITALMAAWP